ncbi:LON peptidase substrate-binding domain-containing protein [Croceimicrobium hydrocarbonivorans]|uniref:LON peptidase substrate-binding domain-containing protein n=1 Tax=Croceimicrobium hydrocarbonivorans TaxID=2761580 RepID=A0A7H0VDK6_9FLAO|nr:LON peptidase substrate-binding domain-containing protein [Croceimicrobium hydrocarbonivorans]QNR23804.1 LON peptidase substrate-binding domain-containing protein [Croceimicrobium hydrocarbonivorans]
MEKFPLFPLNLFMLPGDYTQLYIFEERYKQLINESWEQDSSFGLPFSNKLNARNYGTAVKVHEIVKRHANGEMEIVIRAVGNFRLDKFHYQKEGKLYPCGEVEFFTPDGKAKASEGLLARFKEHLLQSNNLDAELLALESPSIFEIAGVLNLSDIQKMEFVGIRGLAKMEDYLFNYLRYLELLQEQEAHVYQNFYLN